MVKNYFNRIIKKINKKHGQEIDPEDIFLDSSNLAGLDLDRMEGTLDKPISRTADLAPSFLIAVIFLVFIGQLYNLQIKNYSTYKDKADNNRYNTDLILANRGEIFDRNGNILASNIVSSSSYIFKREYISDLGFSNLLGYISYPKADNLKNYWQDNYIGKDGVELIYQDLLSGVNGKKITEKDVTEKLKSYLEEFSIELSNGAKICIQEIGQTNSSKIIKSIKEK